MSPKTVSVFAPAKINLALHITGQRADGYHLLDSLVAFATVGDHLRITPDNALSLTVEGPEAEYVPVDTENLAMQAAALVCDDAGASLTLEKRLPPSSGIGGGSSDAAAAIRGMWELLGKPVSAEWPQASDDRDLTPLKKQIVALGADIPMCLMCSSARVRGVGEIVDPVDLPRLPAVLVNPRISVSTPVIFGELTNKNNPPMPEALPLFPNPGALIDWLSGQRNDLESPAMQFAPVVSWILQELQATKRCGLARMSGSGATCYGLYTDAEAAKIAADQLSQRHPDWWIAECTLGDQSGAARPMVS